MNKDEIKQKLESLDACEPALEWSEGKDLKEIWETCPRGDWMLWLYKRALNYTLQELTLAKGHCANTVRHLMKDQRSLDAVDMAIKFGEGKATIEDLNAASDAATAYAAYAYTSAAAYAYTSAAAYAAARSNNQLLTADICRKHLPFPQL